MLTKRRTISLMMMLLVGLALACGSGEEEADIAAQPAWTVEEIISMSERRERLTESIEIKHCEAPEPQVVECSAGGKAQFTYDLGNTDFQAAELSAGVAELLEVGSTSIMQENLPVPPQGQIFQYDLEKRFTVRRGEASAQSTTGDVKNFNYTFVATCEIVTRSRTTLDCETGQEIVPTITNTPPRSATATPTPTSTGDATEEATGEASPTPEDEVTTTATRTPTPTVTPATTIGQNCTSDPGTTFKDAYEAYRSILGCPKSDLVTIPTIAEESFQGGHLFWRSDNDQVYIILDRRKSDGTELFEGVWELNPPERRWDGSNPDGIGLNPPSGLVEPKRGFGWLWRNHLGQENGPLGWALDREYGFDNVGKVQIFEQGLMFKGSGAKVYVLMNNGFFFAERS